MKVQLLYFASLADRAGCSEETRETVAANPRDLYAEVARAHGIRASRPSACASRSTAR